MRWRERERKRERKRRRRRRTGGGGSGELTGAPHVRGLGTPVTPRLRPDSVTGLRRAADPAVLEEHLPSTVTSQSQHSHSTVTAQSHHTHRSSGRAPANVQPAQVSVHIPNIVSLQVLYTFYTSQFSDH